MYKDECITLDKEDNVTGHANKYVEGLAVSLAWQGVVGGRRGRWRRGGGRHAKRAAYRGAVPSVVRRAEHRGWRVERERWRAHAHAPELESWTPWQWQCSCRELGRRGAHLSPAMAGRDSGSRPFN